MVWYTSGKLSLGKYLAGDVMNNLFISKGGGRITSVVKQSCIML